jgi:hypothetical protein
MSWESEQVDAGLDSFEAWFSGGGTFDAITLAMLQDGNHHIDIHEGSGRAESEDPTGGAVIACADIPAA